MIGLPRNACFAGALASLLACTGTSPETNALTADAPRPALHDALEGTIAVVGAAPRTRVVLQTRDGEQMVVTGDATPLLRRLDGVEIRCDGKVESGRLRVGSFRVVGAGGLPAQDGVLEIDDDVLVLVDRDGRRTRFRPVPSGLRQWVGQRVWVAGVPGQAPEAWGLIAPRR